MPPTAEVAAPSIVEIYIDQHAFVLVVEDDVFRQHWFSSPDRVPQALMANTSADAVRIAEKFEPDVIFLDYDLANGKTTAKFAEYLATRNVFAKIFIHSANTEGQQALLRLLPAAQLAIFGSFEVTSHHQ